MYSAYGILNTQRDERKLSIGIYIECYERIEL